MRDIDDLILRNIKNEYKSVKEISEELKLPYIRVSVRLKQLRKFGMVTFMYGVTRDKGVKPLKYKENI